MCVCVCVCARIGVVQYIIQYCTQLEKLHGGHERCRQCAHLSGTPRLGGRGRESWKAGKGEAGRMKGKRKGKGKGTAGDRG